MSAAGGRARFGLIALLALTLGALLLSSASPAGAQAANSAPTFANASETREVKENRAKGSDVGAPVAATDANNDTLYYSLSGADAATFTIDENSGQILLTRPLDYESRSSYSVTVGASDRKDAGGNAESAPGAVDATVDATVPVTVTVVDVSTTREELVVDSKVRGSPISMTIIVELDPSPPIFDEIEDIRSVRTGKIVRTIDESAPIGSTVGAPVVARDPEQAGPVTYGLAPGHATRLFSIDSSTGQLTTTGELDYESADPSSDGTGRVYFLPVRATDADGQSQLAGTFIYVRNQSREPVAPGNLRVTPIEEGLDVSWNAVAGATGYRVEWRRMQYGPPGHLTWSSFGRKAALAPSGATSYRISGLRPHTPYQVRVSAKNGVGYGAMAFNYDAWRRQIPTGDPQGCVPGNNPPFFTAGDTGSRNVADGTLASGDFGAPFAVTLDYINGATCYTPAPDRQLTYSLDTTTGDHADFNVDAATGQLSTVSTLDRSVKDAYSVTLRVTDGKSQWDDADPSIDDTIVVTINVTPAVAQARVSRNVQQGAEPGPVADTPPGQPDAPTFINVQQTSFRITWTAPAAGSSAITGYGIQYKLTSAGDSAYADVRPRPTGTVTGYNLVPRRDQSVVKGTPYDVRVRARNANGWGPWSDSATAVTASPAPAIVATPTPPPTPGQLAAPTFVNVQQTFFRITWTAPAAGSSAITGYGIQYKLSSEEDTAYAAVKPTPTGTVTGYNLVNRRGQSVVKGTSYDVRVRAKNAAGWGPWSAPAAAVTASPAPPPSAAPATAVTASPAPPPSAAPASGDEAEADDSGQEESAVAAISYQASAHFVQGRVMIRWDDVDGAKRYTVRKNGRLMPGWFIATAFFNGDVQENTRYQYRITAYDSEDSVLAVMTATTRK